MAYPVYEDNGGLVSVEASSIDVTYPSTVNSGDILIVQVITGIATGNWTTPSGWTKVGDVFYAGTGALLYGVYWKRADGTETGSQTFVNNTSDTLAGIISRYSGCVSSGSPIEDPAFTSDRTITEYTLYDFASLTTLGAERLGLILLGVSNDQASIPPSGWTEQFDLGSAVGTDSQLAASTLQVATAQTIAAGTGDLSRNNSYGNVILALIPASDADVLTADNILAQNPIIGQASIGQEHSLSSDNILAQNVLIGQPTMGQSHILSADIILAQNPIINQASIGQGHVLLANEVITQAVIITIPNISQNHALLANIIEAQNVIIGQPSLAQDSGLLADNIISGAVLIGEPILLQIHSLGADNILSQNVLIGIPILQQNNVLLPNDIISQAVLIGSPTLDSDLNVWSEIIHIKTPITLKVRVSSDISSTKLLKSTITRLKRLKSTLE